ncbi:unnamed protein product [Lampetra planeri]
MGRAAANGTGQPVDRCSAQRQAAASITNSGAPLRHLDSVQTGSGEGQRQPPRWRWTGREQMIKPPIAHSWPQDPTPQQRLETQSGGRSKHWCGGDPGPKTSEPEKIPREEDGANHPQPAGRRTMRKSSLPSAERHSFLE